MKGLAARKSYGERFALAVEAIKKLRLPGYKFDTDIGKALNLTPQQVNQLKKGKYSLQIEIVDQMVSKFGVNSAFLLHGALPIFLPAENDTPEEATRKRVIDIVENDLTEMTGNAASNLFYDKEDGVSFSTYKEFKHGRIKTISFRFKRFLQRAYGVNPKYIETGEGEKFLPVEEVREPEPEYKREFNPRVITVDRDNEDKMILIPQKVAAGYLGNIADPEWVEEQPTISLPDMPRGKTTRAFEIEGDSMLPHFHEGAYVGCTFVENLDLIKEGYVYIVVTDDGVTMKRVFKRGTALRLVSDNSHYKPFEIPLKDVREIWKVHRAITAQFPPPSETDAKVNHLELEVVKLGKTVALIAQKVGV